MTVLWKLKYSKRRKNTKTFKLIIAIKVHVSYLRSRDRASFQAVSEFHCGQYVIRFQLLCSVHSVGQLHHENPLLFERFKFLRKSRQLPSTYRIH